ncbi:MAG TPA: histidinol dehydrogenase, partial [Cyclobacteriaceae bacterium]|nr:histidinol dehydrogenase [Cyclobacteriaceae bacterium]
MKTINNPSRSTWNELTQRPQLDSEFLDGAVKKIIDDVKANGDRAIKALTLQFDKIEIDNLLVSEKEFSDARNQLSGELMKAIEVASNNIEKFHASQKRETQVIETTEGVNCWRKAVAIEKVGLYIPGGSAPLFSTVLMLGIPAKLAGCSEVILCTPPDKEGKINAAILFAAYKVGITKIFKVGGAQAIAAMAFGTETIPKTYKIFGPGNQFVTKAKQIVNQSGIAIDMPAGPSEVLVIADETADPSFVAADLLSQAEHGADSQVVLVTTSQTKAEQVAEQIQKQLATLPRQQVALKALENSRYVIFNNEIDVIDFAN